MVHTDPGWQEDTSGTTTPPPLRMADYFWAEDNSALSTIQDRMQRSKRTCETILKMFEKRAQIEQEYGERLLKLSQIHLNEAEDSQSTIFETLGSLPVAMEAAARAHIDLAQQMHHLLETPLANFIKEQKTLRKKTMESIDQVQNLRYMRLENVKRAQQAYISECENYERLRRREYSDEELAEAEQKKAAVDQEYKLAIGILESVSKNWIEDWKKACDTFQSLEEKRLNYTSATLLAYTNMVSNVYTIGDHSCERIRVSLENMNVIADMDNFIRTKSTGCVIPEIPTYNPFFDPDPDSAPRVVREINIPVVDEELRSVNEQLKLLPNARPNAKPEMVKQDRSVTPAQLDRKYDQQSRTIEREATPSPFYKALPSLPRNAQPEGPVVITQEHDTGQRTTPVGYQPKMRRLPSIRDRPPALETLVDTNAYAKTNTTEPLNLMYPQEPKYNVDRNHRRSSQVYIPEQQQQQRERPQLKVDVDVQKSTSEDTAGNNNKGSTRNKKKSKHTAMFPFLKKSSPTKDRNRFSLAIFSHHKKEEPSPTKDSYHSLATSPSPVTPYTPPAPSFTSSYSNHYKKGSSLRHTSALALEDGTPVIEYVQAQWSYGAKIDSEISFSKDDILAVIEKKRDGWWDAQIVHSVNNAAVNTRGLVPGNFMGSL